MKNSILILSVLIFTVFTITLTETIQISDGLLASSTKLIYEMQIGETQMKTWALTNNEPESFFLEFYSIGKGSELLVFEEFIEFQPATRKEIEVFVIVPENHKNNVEYHPELFALKRGNIEEGESGFIVNLQMRTIPIIKIGDNPVFTPEVVKQNEPKKEIVPKPKVIEEKEIPETLEEKLARIQASNEKNSVDDVWQEEFEEEAVNDYIPEPIPDPVDTPFVIDEGKTECHFIDWFLSLFGIGKC